jgi:iron complex outermembrane receptor protein
MEKALIRLVSTVAVATLATAPGWAQQGDQANAGPTVTEGAAAPEASTTGLQDIVVTARRREESLQKTPVAITAFSSGDLNRHSIINVSDIGRLTPSLNFDKTVYDPFSANVGIRGQKTNDSILNVSPAIGLYIDDVYQGNTLATSATSLLDVQRIEVLKGPQGTLYGRNTTGGALKIVTALPDYDGASGAVRVGLGNYNLDRESAMINVPLVADQMALRLSGSHEHHGGYGYDTNNRRPLADLKADAIRGTLRIDPTSGFQIVLRGDYARARSGGTVEYLGALAPPTVVNPFLLNAAIYSNVLTFAQAVPVLTGRATPAQLAGVLAGQKVIYDRLLPTLNRKSYRQAYFTPQQARLEVYGSSVTLQKSLTDDILIKSISALRYVDRVTQVQIDGTIYPGLYGVPSDLQSRQLTQELQLDGKAIGGRLKWILGYYYYDMVGTEGRNPTNQLPFINPRSPNFSSQQVRQRSNAFFGQATFALAPAINVTGGLRWTRESARIRATEFQGNPGVCAIPAAQQTPPGACVARIGQTFKNLSYTGGIDWSPTDAVLLYAKTSRGFKAGGQNKNPPFLPFAAETVTDYEAGAKLDLLDRRLRVNTALYHSKYDNIQRTVLVAQNGGVFTSIANAAAATIDGVEAEITARPVQPLVLGASLAYTDAKYQTYVNQATGQDLSANSFQGQPRWQWSLSALLTVPTPAGDLAASVDYTRQTTVELLPDSKSIYTNGYSTQKGYGLLNARVTLKIDRFDADVALWGRNLTNKLYQAGATDATGSAGFGAAFLGDPRIYGVELTKRF